MKLAGTTPVRKREDSIIVKNYRPVSILQNSIKYPRTVDVKQIIECIYHFFLTPFLCDYRKGFSTRTALVRLIEKWKYQLDKNRFAGAVMMDLSKSFDTINYNSNLSRAKLMHIVMRKML